MESPVTFIDDIDQNKLAEIIRHADGGINHDYYRERAKQHRSETITRLTAAFWGIIGRLGGEGASARIIETPWRPEVMTRKS
jgi:hypothetical protein